MSFSFKIRVFVLNNYFFDSKWHFEKCYKATLMIFPNDFNSLVNYFSFCMWLFHTATCFTVIIFRRKMPISQNPRLFKVPIILPYLISLIGCYLIAVPFFQVFIWSFSTHFSTFSKQYFFSGIRHWIYFCTWMDSLWIFTEYQYHKSFMLRLVFAITNSLRTLV